MGQSCLNALHTLRETETEAGLKVQLQSRALASSQDTGTTLKGNFKKSKDTERHQKNRADDVAACRESPRR